MSPCLNIIVTTFFRDHIFQKLDIILFGNWKWVNLMVLSASLENYKKIIYQNKNVKIYIII